MTTRRICGVWVRPRNVIQPSEEEAGIMRYQLTDGEWATIRPMLPNKARGVSGQMIGVS